MGRVTIRGLSGPHVIVSKAQGKALVGTNGEEGNSSEFEIVTLQNTPVISLPDGKHELEIYKCKGRQCNRKTKKDMYVKGGLFTKVTVTTPEENTIYV